MPVYNSVATIGRALQSLLSQTFRDFELLVSDNASNDGTYSLLEAYSSRDPRIRLVRQPKNIGAHANFAYVLRAASAPYFMWAAADDWWAPVFVEKNLSFLEAHPDYVSSVSQTRIDPPVPDYRPGIEGTFALTDDAATNIRRFVSCFGANSRFYGLHRRAALIEAWTDEPFWGSDILVMVRLLRHGKQNEVNEVLYLRGGKGASSLPYNSIRRMNLGFVDTWVPFRRFTFELLRQRELRWDLSLWVKLAYLNWRLSGHMIRRHALRLIDERLNKDTIRSK